MAITQENINYLEARHAEFWVPTSSGNATLKKATVGDNPNPRNPSIWEIRLKDGYKFVGIPQMRHYWVSSWTAFYNMAEVYNEGDEQRAYIKRDFKGVGEVDFNFEVTLASAIYEITQSDLDLLASQNVVMKINNVTVSLGSKISKTSTVTLTANAGFKLKQAHFQDGSGNISYFTIENGIGTFTPNNETKLTSFSVLTCSPVYKTTFEDYIQLSGITATINGTAFNTDVDLFESDVIKLTPETNYVILEDETFFKYGTDSYQKFTFTGGVGQLTLENYAYTGLQVRSKNTQVRLTVDSEMLKTLQNNNVSMFINNVPVTNGTTAINGDTIRIKANTGYELAGRPSFYIYNDSSGYQGTEYLKLIDENITAEIVLDLYSLNYLTYLEVLTNQVDIVVGSNNLYKISKANLKQINIDRFVRNGDTVIDYGTNILGVINLPFSIKSDFIQDDELIKLGTHETTVKAPKISTDKLYVNLGDISVPMPDNTLGFSNATATIHLPYANSLTLDINEVMGQVINVEYVIDLYNGSSYVNIKSNKTDSIIASNMVDLGIDVPYSSMVGENNQVYNANMKLGGDNHVKSPYIEITQKMPILGNGFFTIPISDERALTEQKGFVKIDEIELQLNAPDNELQEIKSLLTNGVIIK